MKTTPIRYVRDMAAARAFYEALGLRLDFAGRPPRYGPLQGQAIWMELDGGGGALALHYSPPEASDPPMSLSFEAEEPLEKVVARLREAGYEPASAIIDESFGRSFTVRDPEGLLLQVNEQDRDLQR